MDLITNKTNAIINAIGEFFSRKDSKFGVKYIIKIKEK